MRTTANPWKPVAAVLESPHEVDVERVGARCPPARWLPGEAGRLLRASDARREIER